MVSFTITHERERSRLFDRPAKRVAVGRGFAVGPPVFTQIRERPRRAELEEDAVPVFPRDGNSSGKKFFLLRGLVASASDKNEKEESASHLT